MVVGDSQCGKTSLIQRYCCGTLPHTYTPTLFDTRIASSVVEGRKVQIVIQDTAGQEDLDRLRPPFYLQTDVIIVCFDVDNPDSWDKVRKVWVPEARRYCGKHVPLLLVANKMDLIISPVSHPPLSSSLLREHSQDINFVDTLKASVQTVHSGNPALCDLNCAQDDVKEKRDSGFGSTENLFPSGVQEEECSLLGQSRSEVDKTKQTFSHSGKRSSVVKADPFRFSFSDTKTPPSRRQCQRRDSLAIQIGAVGYFETSAVLNDGIDQVFDTALTAAMASKQWRKKYRL